MVVHLVVQDLHLVVQNSVERMVAVVASEVADVALEIVGAAG